MKIGILIIPLRPDFYILYFTFYILRFLNTSTLPHVLSSLNALVSKKNRNFAALGFGQSFLILFVLGMWSPQVLAQSKENRNLVPNGGFEFNDGCPESYSKTASDFKASNWFSANGGTPDYFNPCSAGDAKVPANWAGVSDAVDGNGYAGIYGWRNSGNYREYIECALNQLLIRDTTYQLSFHYKLSSYSRYSIDRIGLALVSQKVEKPDAGLLSIKPVLDIVLESPIGRETGTWQLAQMQIKARGDEAYLIIGNFAGDSEISKYKLLAPQGEQEMLHNSAYYYVDDVSIVPVFKSETVAVTDHLFRLHETYSLQTVQFEFNSYQLLPVSFAELDRLAEWLKHNPTIAIGISGHTDDVGNDAYNVELSQKRAQSVAHYLSSKGVDTSRIRSMGYGKSKPLVKGVDEASRRTNRRVEFVLRSE
jgi:outer membrane protein OmpA-like peptidoglycan-associated protein